MPCESHECTCSMTKHFGDYLTKYIKLCGTFASNLKGHINTVFKYADNRFSPEYVETENAPHFTVVRVPFSAKVKLMSMVFRTTFDEVRIYPDDVTPGNWKKKKEFESFTFNKTKCLFECFLKNKKFKDAGSVCFVLIGNDEEVSNQIFYVGFKGKYMCEFSKPVIAKYQTVSTQTMIMREMYEIIN